VRSAKYSAILYFVENVPERDLMWVVYAFIFTEVTLWMGDVTRLLLLIAFGEEEASK
jgi:hypothetical protein